MNVVRFGFALSAFLGGLSACAPESGSDNDASSSAEQALNANSWKHQASFNLGCADDAVTNEVTKKSRRHFYSFAGDAGTTISLSLKANWPKSYGAYLAVTDATGMDLGEVVKYNKKKATLDVTIPSDGKYFVYASPWFHKNVKSNYEYTLSVSCVGGSNECSTDAECSEGEYCAPIFCITTPCPTGLCTQTEPQCGHFATPDGRFYAKNFSNAGDAYAWIQAPPDAIDGAVEPGSCAELGQVCTKEYAPVCGTSGDVTIPENFGNACQFRAQIFAEAGIDGESKGKATVGECVAGPLCAETEVMWQGSTTPTIYAKNFDSAADAQAWVDTFGPYAVSSFQFEGTCDQGWACPANYAPVCGVIFSGPEQTYSNDCSFRASVRSAAGSDDFAKGYARSGACCPTDVNYVANSPEACMLVKYFCAPGTTSFSNECGCGCE